MLVSDSDIVAQSPDGETILIVEAKTKRGTSTEWAAQMRRNLGAHLKLSAPFFLLATPDKFYLWRCGELKPNTIETPIEIDPSELLEPYTRTAVGSDERLSESSFELIVASWLREVAKTPAEEAATRFPTQLFDSGLVEALRGTFIRRFRIS